MRFFSFISNRIQLFFSGEERRAEDPDSSRFFGKEKAIAFAIAFFFALCLWFIVNMNRDFNITIDVPIQIVNLPEDVAISSDVPEFASVNLSGEGWKLINLYNNPPKVNLSAESRQINLFEQIRNQAGVLSNLNVLQVDPIILNIETEEKISKKIPVRLQADITLREQFGLISDPVIEPDSVTVSGARSKLEDLVEWETVPVELTNVNQSLEQRIDLKAPDSGVIADPPFVFFRLDVAEFTESEVRVPIRTRNLPSGKAVTYNPSSIIVRFDIPINQFVYLQETRPFVAFVDYAAIEADTTGFITPQIEKASPDLFVKIRNFHPQSISYFNIIPD